MLCKDFKCKYQDEDGECCQIGGECIGDLCGDWGECLDCKQVDMDECDGLKKQ